MRDTEHGHGCHPTKLSKSVSNRTPRDGGQIDERHEVRALNRSALSQTELRQRTDDLGHAVD
jgi:hypothetical protein